MERDCIISQGASKFLHERLFSMSDPFQVVICNGCGMMCSSPKFCNICNDDDVDPVNLPYASKLLLMQLGAMAIKTPMSSRQDI